MEAMEKYVPVNYNFFSVSEVKVHEAAKPASPRGVAFILPLGMVFIPGAC